MDLLSKYQGHLQTVGKEFNWRRQLVSAAALEIEGPFRIEQFVDRVLNNVSHPELRRPSILRILTELVDAHVISYDVPTNTYRRL